jgi:hypothetical protein
MKRLFVLRAQDEVWRNLLREMGERLQAGKALAVEVDDYKSNRSKAQNAVFHMWAGDVSAATGEAKHGGRLKLQYFVPVLLRDDAKWAWVWRQTGAKLSYEQQVEFLGEPNVLGSTSRCTVAQFAEALDGLWAGEAHLGLRNPQDFGLDWRVR